jgi:uncharacterized cupin superfamily protein
LIDGAEDPYPIVIQANQWVAFKKGFLCVWRVDELIKKHYQYFDDSGDLWQPTK